MTEKYNKDQTLEQIAYSVYLITKNLVMKKVLTVLAVIILIACNDTPNDNKQVTPQQEAALATDTIPRTEALAMINHYNDLNVNHDLNHIVKSISLDSLLIQKMQHSKVHGVKFITAAYLDTDPDSSLRNKPTILLQLKVVTNSYSYFYFKLSDEFVCPPPTDCFAVTNLEK